MPHKPVCDMYLMQIIGLFILLASLIYCISGYFHGSFIFANYANRAETANLTPCEDVLNSSANLSMFLPTANLTSREKVNA